MKQPIRSVLLGFAVLAVAATTVRLSAQPKVAPASASFGIFFYEPSASFADRTNANATAYWKRWSEYIGGLQQSGKMENGGALMEPAAGVILHGAGKPQPLKSKIELSGYMVIKVADLTEAIAVAKRSPALAEGGSIQVRPILPMDQHKAGN